MRINPTTIHEVGFKPGEKCMALCQELADLGYQFLSGYVPAYRQIPLRLGFYFKPMFTSGPNTYKRPSRESKVVREGIGDDALSIYHSLPKDASALLTLLKPEDLASLGSFWFADREVLPTSGLEPIGPSRDGTIGFGWVINALIIPAQVIWWESMITRPKLGRFGRKLEGSGKVRVFAIACPCCRPW